MKIITASQIASIIAANEELKGTSNYFKYHMCYEYKHNNRWKYGGYGIPRSAVDMPVKSYRGTQYIMVSDDRRFTITEAVITLLEGINQ